MHRPGQKPHVNALKPGEAESTSALCLGKAAWGEKRQTPQALGLHSRDAMRVRGAEGGDQHAQLARLGSAPFLTLGPGSGERPPVGRLQVFLKGHLFERQIFLSEASKLLSCGLREALLLLGGLFLSN